MLGTSSINSKQIKIMLIWKITHKFHGNVQVHVQWLNTSYLFMFVQNLLLSIGFSITQTVINFFILISVYNISVNCEKFILFNIYHSKCPMIEFSIKTPAIMYWLVSETSKGWKLLLAADL